MTSSLPLYLLFAEAEAGDAGSRWRFSLEHVASGVIFAASDVETIDRSERLELLAVVRGLEALEQPARVTLVTRSRYVSRGLRRGLSEWRQNNWQWDRFGKLAPVRDADLWRRIDRAMEFHRIDCRLWQFDGPELEPLRHASPVAEVAVATLAATEAIDAPRSSHDLPAPRRTIPRRRLRRLTQGARAGLQRAAAMAATTIGDAFAPGGLAAG